MGKLLRVMVYVAGILVVLMLAAVILIPLLVDPNDFKDEISQAVESNTGRSLDMQGDLALSVFPWLGLDIGPTSLSNAPGFSERPFASVEAVQVRVKLLPLLRKQLEMDTLVLQGLRASLETDAKGRTNWEDLAGAESDAADKAPADVEEGTNGTSPIAALAIGGVEITDAAVIWDDQQSGARYDVEGLSLRTGAIAPGATVPVELNLVLKSSEPEINGPVSLQTSVTLAEDGSKIRIAGASLQTDLAGAALPGGQLKSSVDFNTELDMNSGQLDLTDLVISLLGLDIRAEVHGRDLFGNAEFDGSVKIDEFSPRKTIKALGQPVPETSDSTALTSADGSLQLAGTTDSLKISDLQFRLDDTRLDGSASVQNFSKPAIVFGLNIDQINVDRYLPPPAEEPAAADKPAAGKKPSAGTPAGAAAVAAPLIPVEPLRDLNVDGSLKIAKLQVAQLRSRKIIVKLRAKDGLVSLSPMNAKLYKGSYKGNVELDVRGKEPKIALDEKLSDVQVGPLLKDMTGEDRLTGTTNLSMKLTTRGQTEADFKKRLNGNVSFAFLEGAVKGFNLAAILRNAKARLKGKPLPKETGPDQTDFSEISGTAVIKNGVAHNDDLKAASPLLRVSGVGDVDLPNEQLDYLVNVKVVDTLKGQGGKDLGELKGLSVPIKLSGTFSEPEYKVKLDKLLQDNAEKQIREKVNKELEKKLGNQLEGLFK